MESIFRILLFFSANSVCIIVAFSRNRLASATAPSFSCIKEPMSSECFCNLMGIIIDLDLDLDEDVNEG